MNISISASVNDATYCRNEDVEPTFTANELTIYTGYGSRRGWGTPGTTSTIILNDDDFCAIHVGYHHKHGGGQFWRYYTTDGTQITQIEWRQIPDEQRARVIEAADQKAPGWAKSPGKLRANYAKPSDKTRIAYKLVEERADGTLVSLYDGQTVYTIGKRLVEAARGGYDEWTGKTTHNGGYYAHPTREQVAKLFSSGNLVPERCLRPGMVLAMLQVEISGTIVNYPNGKLAATYLKPVEVLATFVYQADAVAA